MRQKDLIQLGATGILVIILILALGNAFKKMKSRNFKKVFPKSVELASQDVDQVNRLSSQNLYNRLSQELELIELKRDPFTAAPIVSEQSSSAGTVLSGILWDKNVPLAILDGKVVKEGARLGNKTVVDIKPDRVILSDGQVLSELKLKR